MTLLEVTVAAVLIALLVGVMAAALSMAKSHFLAGELAHAVHGAVVMGSLLEDDLRAAVRDPDLGNALAVRPTTRGGVSIGLYRRVLARIGTALVPVRWTLAPHPTDPVSLLTRTSWDPIKDRPTVDHHAWVAIPTLAGVGAGSRPGFALVTDLAESEVQSLLLTVAARNRKVEGPGAGVDSVTIPIGVAVPRFPEEARELFRPLRRLIHLPPD